MKIKTFKDVWAERLIYWALCICTFGAAFALRLIISEAIIASFREELNTGGKKCNQ